MPHHLWSVYEKFRIAYNFDVFSNGRIECGPETRKGAWSLFLPRVQAMGAASPCLFWSKID